MKLTVLILQVGDVESLERCHDWYTRLGLASSAPDNPGESYWFDTGNGTSIGIHTGPRLSEPERITVGLEVDDVDVTYRQLSDDGFLFHGLPRTKEWGRSVSLSDPGGHTVTIVSRPA
jgi:hypothetical protein